MITRLQRLFPGTILCAVLACNDTNEAACPPVRSSVPAIPFVDSTDAMGIDAAYHNDAYCTFEDQVGPGVCVFDFDADGDNDIYFPDRSPHPNRLYRNDGGIFADVSQGSGTDLTDDSIGCLAFDHDSDGDLDLYVSNNGPDRLLRNEGGGLFHDVSDETNISSLTDGLSFAATAGDIDGDGDLDLLIGRYIEPGTCPPGCVLVATSCNPARNLLLENRGVDGFHDVAVERGLIHEDYTFSAVFFDFDRDGDLDLFVGNCSPFATPNRLYVNDGRGYFEDRSAELGLQDIPIFTMGVDLGDYDGDGVIDIVATDLDARPMHLITCSAERCTEMPVADSLPYVEWTVGFRDFDQDRDLDLFASTGQLIFEVGPKADLRGAPSTLFYNDGRGGYVAYFPRMEDPLAKPAERRGAGFGDLDGDGDIDIVVASNNSRHQVLLNQASVGHYLTVSLPTLSVGARVTVSHASHTQVNVVRIGGYFFGSSDPDLHFGLNEDCKADITIEWLDGRVAYYRDVPADQVFHVPP